MVMIMLKDCCLGCVAAVMQEAAHLTQGGLGEGRGGAVLVVTGVKAQAMVELVAMLDSFGFC